MTTTVVTSVIAMVTAQQCTSFAVTEFQFDSIFHFSRKRGILTYSMFYSYQQYFYNCKINMNTIIKDGFAHRHPQCIVSSLSIGERYFIYFSNMRQ